MVTTPTIMYLGFAMHKIARMDDVEYRPLHRPGKKTLLVSRSVARDYEEAEDNGEEDPMIAEVIELEEKKKKEAGGDERSKKEDLSGGVAKCKDVPVLEKRVSSHVSWLCHACLLSPS